MLTFIQRGIARERFLVGAVWLAKYTFPPLILAAQTAPHSGHCSFATPARSSSEAEISTS